MSKRNIVLAIQPWTLPQFKGSRNPEPGHIDVNLVTEQDTDGQRLRTWY